MRITNRTRNTLLGQHVTLASTWLGRMRGYLGRPAPMEGEGILLIPCNAVHSYFMNFELDILFLDQKGTVLEVIRGFAPWKRTKRVRGSEYVLEVPVGTLDSSGTEVGDELSWREPAPYTLSVLFQEHEDVTAPTVRDRSKV